MYDMIFHGSNIFVQDPVILRDGFYKDFGYGFYCTGLRKQAEKWALLKRGQHIVNQYEYKDEDTLKKLIFEEMNEEWLDFIADCRRGIEHDYDIVEGPMANDPVWNYVEDFVRGDISRAAFWELAKFKKPTHQIVFCTERSLSSIKYIGGYEL